MFEHTCFKKFYPLYIVLAGGVGGVGYTPIKGFKKECITKKIHKKKTIKRTISQNKKKCLECSETKEYAKIFL